MPMPLPFPVTRLAIGLAVAFACGSAFAQAPELMLTPARDAAPETIAEDYLRQSAAARGLADSDLEYRHQDSSYATRHNGVSHQFFQQFVDGLPVYKAIAQVNVMPDGRVLSATSAFESNVQARTSAREPALTAPQMLTRVAAHFGIDRFNVPLPERAPTGRQQHARYPGGMLSESPIDMELVYEPVGTELRLAWRVVIDHYQTRQEHLDMRFDALTGALLAQDNWVDDIADGAAAPAAAAYNAEYRVFGLGVESPGHPGASHDLVSNPPEANASPSGWQDTRTSPAAGAPEALYTRGNNVRAQWDSVRQQYRRRRQPPARGVGRRDPDADLRFSLGRKRGAGHRDQPRGFGGESLLLEQHHPRRAVAVRLR